MKKAARPAPSSASSWARRPTGRRCSTPPRRSRPSACRSRSASSRPTGRRSSSRRTPQTAEARGLEVIIAGAGGAAHLPGMLAAQTAVPVLGVPVESQALEGLDSLLSIAQMPAGVPVGTLAIGKAGAINAALLAVGHPLDLAPRPEEEAPRVPLEADEDGSRRDPAVIVPPGSVVGVLGSGQLGRMFALAARGMGYRVHTYSPEEDSPTGHVADVEVSAPYDDLDRLKEFARGIDVLTFEFENVPRAALDAFDGLVPVHPGAEALWVTQNRETGERFS